MRIANQWFTRRCRPFASATCRVKNCSCRRATPAPTTWASIESSVSLRARPRSERGLPGGGRGRRCPAPTTAPKAKSSTSLRITPARPTPLLPRLSDVAPGTQMAGTDLRLAKSRTVSVRGRVTDSAGGDPRRLSVMIVARGIGAFNSDRQSGVDQNGNFDIRGVAPGSYVLIAMSNSEPLAGATPRVYRWRLATATLNGSTS